MFNYTCFGAARVNTTPLDLDINTKKILDLAEKSQKEGIKLLAFPELCITGYGCGDMFEHQELLKGAVNCLLKLKYELPEGITVGVGLPLADTTGKVFDCYAMVCKGAILGISAAHSFYNAKDSRVRNFSTPYSDECMFNIGTNHYGVCNCIETSEGIVGILFNEGDLNYLQDIELLIIPEAARFELDSADKRELKVKALSLSLKCPVLLTNLSGCESGSDVFDSLCMIADKGECVARSNLLSFKREDLFTVKNGITPRLSQYDTIVRAVGLGLFDWMLKTYSHGFALSMSGGADSALCATCVCYGQLAAIEELGFEKYSRLLEHCGFKLPKYTGSEDLQSYIKKKVMPDLLTTVYQGSIVSGSITREAAAGVSSDLGADHHEWSIAKLVEEYTSIVNSISDTPMTWEQDDLALQNIQARSRAPGIWMIANRYNKLLITTCNASEDAVGYCTMDGDTAGGVAPIGDISKSRVLKINEHIAKDGLMVNDKGLKLECPQMMKVCVQAPTAELRPGGNQTDERDLMPYVVLDRIHVLHQNNLLMPKMILDTIENEFTQFTREELKGFVLKYFRKLSVSQWKRERGATTFHIESSDLNAKNGFVFPLLNDGFKSILKALD
ncbi:NAD(+) synthase [Succinivibrio dextrinosolvens]|uniref:Glutamine-dependent NAD(+) synthetase n=1 Tax=Succinivibrio dextrinosolvens TaxID=83771 RepID=A0A662Z945_9GAMM|nr:NAD(+) synthase [Succinivibrio dextrinosolvens]SFJ82152.1 NAD+ synthase (glutamine-hydrolysing) [Succinivibrio dextrinosolvens]